MQAEELKQIVVTALEELKGNDIAEFDVRDMTSITDFMIIASGTSNRHVKSLADAVVMACKKAGSAPLGVEGEREGEWVLVDLGDVVVHVMQPRIREFYALEKLWGRTEQRRGKSEQA
ncbi:ribosome silencing factor [Thiogranum longum]